jgi:predicted small lipoprotein YifL
LLYIPRFYDILNAKEAFIVKKFQKSLSLILLLSLVFSLAACGKKPDGPVPSSAPTVPTTAPTDPTKPINPHIVVANTEGMTDLQKAIVVTAESYLLRGKYAQYDQYSLTALSSGNVGRRQVAMKAPDDYTSQNYGYTDCSGFVYDLYYFALGMSITDGDRHTKGYCTSSAHTILREEPEKNNFSKLSKEELAAKE